MPETTSCMSYIVVKFLLEGLAWNLTYLAYVILKSYLPSKKIYLSRMTSRTFLSPDYLALKCYM